MKFVLICCSFLVVCTASVLPDVDSKNLQENSYMPPELEDYLEANFPEVPHIKIVGGETAKVNQYPYQAGLKLLMNNGRESWCGGSLISDQVVITAAHCLQGVRQAIVILGAHERENDKENGRITQIVTSSNFIIHRRWSSSNMVNDIALIKLNSKVTFNDQIQPIVLPPRSNANTSFEGAVTVITGWGHFDSSKKLAPFLRHATGSVVSNKACKKFFGKYIHSSNICMDGKDGRGTCNGDSGGPLAAKTSDGTPVLIGLTSFGSAKGCHSRWPTVFTRITSHLQWISDNTGIPIA